VESTKNPLGEVIWDGPRGSWDAKPIISVGLRGGNVRRVGVGHDDAIVTLYTLS